MLMYGAKLILKQYLKLFSSLLRAVRPWEVLLLSAEGIRLGQAGSGLWAQYSPIIGPRSWILVLDSHSPAIHQALFGLWHAAPVGVFLWSMF